MKMYRVSIVRKKIITISYYCKKNTENENSSVKEN